MKAHRITTVEEFTTYNYIENTWKAHISYKYCWIKMSVQYIQLHIISNYLAKYENCRSNKV